MKLDGASHHAPVFRNLISDSVFYGIVLVAARLVGIISLPYIARIIEPSDYALLDSLSVLPNYVLPLVMIGVDSAIARYFYLDPSVTVKLTSSGFITGLLVSIIVTSILIITGPWLSGVYLNRPDMSDVFRLSLFNIPFVFVSAYMGCIFKLRFSRVPYIASTLLGPVVFSVCTLVTALFGSLTREKYLVYYLASNVIGATVSIIFARGSLEFSLPDRKHLRRLYGYGAPFMIVSVLSSLFGLSERVFANRLLPTSIAGLYFFAYKFLSFSVLVNRALQMSWGPLAVLHSNDRNATREYNRILMSATLAFNGLTILVILFEPLIFDYIGGRGYENARVFLPYIFGANTLLALSSITNIGINIANSTKTHVANYSASWFSFVVVAWLVSITEKLLAVPIALFFSRVILYILQSESAAKLSSAISFQWGKALTLSIATTILAILLLNNPPFRLIGV